MEPSPFQDLAFILKNELPSLKGNLAENISNLAKVADFCEDNYLNSSNHDKSRVYEDTKNYAIQALASVAYQINTIATSFLQLLDLQSNQFNELETNLSDLSEDTNVHKEKVARREIGTLTTNKTLGRQPLFIKPSNPEKLVRYVRKPLDYSVLDDIGHGVRLSPQENKSRHMIYSNGLQQQQQQQQQPSTPPSIKNANASLSKATGASSSLIYAQRSSIQPAPPVVVPPTDYASRHDLIMNNGHQYNQYGNRQQASYNQMLMMMNNENVYATRHNGILNTNNMNRYTGAMVENGGSVRSRATSQPPGSARAPLHMDNYDPATQQQNGAEPQYMAQQSYLPQFIPAAPNHFFEATTTLPRKSTRGFRRRFENLDWAPEQYLEMAIACYDYESTRDDELTFREDTIIFVVAKNDDGWFEGVIEPGIRGLFPGNYVEPLCE
ncbi:unnamed protein product [Adineta steineri]|uniref:SH3 domain-containing protein n=1 Tax=Adineta steineri TaxID=433720 RepID=A0A816DQS3_9BILA|nr:unnamed protein product [Adineta steineri]CAF1475769.1 unnamed protein product [Adineta steineri]CAF1637211.1 unnamed protein product [Adineta steineri]CAF4109436.1 unnamed protein product [Adineta steineri]